jgi:hypothetical protein
MGGEQERAAQAQAIRSYLANLAPDPDRRVVVLGDFNAFQFELPLLTLPGAGPCTGRRRECHGRAVRGHAVEQWACGAGERSRSADRAVAGSAKLILLAAEGR